MDKHTGKGNNSLSHIMAIHDIRKTCGPVDLGRYCLLFNGDRISREEAIRVFEADSYSPYVLAIPEVQWAGLFLNKDPKTDKEDKA